MPELKSFIEQLRGYSAPQVFNPWQDYDADYDMGINAPETRRLHLEKYLRLRIPNAKYIFIAEALGYQGGHFSGIAMTSERILIGNHPKVNPLLVLGEVGKRTSSSCSPHIPKKTQRELGFNEPTATVIWEELIDNDVSPFDVVLWNIFPFHPYKAKGLLTNRTPEPKEVAAGLKYVRLMMKLCSNAKFVSIGQSSAITLDENGIENVKLRHPSNGGISEFRSGFKKTFYELLNI